MGASQVLFDFFLESLDGKPAISRSGHGLALCLTHKGESRIVRIRKRNFLSKKRSFHMAEKGLSKPVKLKKDLAEFLGATELPRTEITQKIWEYVKSKKLQTKTQNGKPENAGKFIVADEKLLPIFKNTKVTSKAGKLTDLSGIQLGQTIDMMQMASVVSANIEA